jgi:DNA primase
LADDRVKQVKDANDIVDVVGSYIALHPAGATFKGLCPFHDDHRPSLDVDPRRQRYRCWVCNKYGDVISFVQEYDKVSFPEALELLARRAGITLEKRSNSPQDQTRALLLDVLRWATREYHDCLLDSPLAEDARAYLGQRGLKGETIRRYSLGYAPLAGDWLVDRAASAGIAVDLLETVGLIAPRQSGAGYYDRFRDRVQFPIRDVRGQTIGFGGRVLPNSPLAERGPKYYNSTTTPVFNKSEQLYGLDHARGAAAAAGYLAVVEGYTDVLMAHQMGVGQVVATMGTALNARHVQKLRRFCSRVVLVFDADAGGNLGVDRALEVFASHDVDLAVATLPQDLDPCDLLLQQGADAFRQVLEGAADALDFKMKQVLGSEGPTAALGVEARRRAVDAVLGVIAQAPVGSRSLAIKTQLMVTRIAQRLALKEEMVWARLEELRQRRSEPPRPEAEASAPRSAKAAPEERELLEVLLAEPDLVPKARTALEIDAVAHPGLQRLLKGLYDLHDRGEPPTLDQLRPNLENSHLAAKALELADMGRRHPDRLGWLQTLLKRFDERRQRPVTQELQNQLHAARDHAAALELLRQLQQRNVVGAGQPASYSPEPADEAGARS